MISPLNSTDFLIHSLLLEKFKEEEELLKKITFKALQVKQGQIIHYEKTHPMGVFFIKNGRVKISKTMVLKKEKMVGMYSSGKFVGVEECLNNESYRYTATAIEDTELWFISKTVLAREPVLIHYLRMHIK